MIQFFNFQCSILSIFPENITAIASNSLENTEMVETRNVGDLLGQKNVRRAVIEGREDFFRNMTIYNLSPIKEFQKVQQGSPISLIQIFLCIMEYLRKICTLRL